MIGHKYSRVHQLGFIVENMEMAMIDYAEIYNVKRWYRPVDNLNKPILYRGRPIKDNGFDLVIGYCGKTEIELITSNADENVYVNFLRDNGPGLHHVSYFVRNLARAILDYKKIGFEIVQEGSLGSMGVVTNYAYLIRPGANHGNVVELQETRVFNFLSVSRSNFLTWAGLFTGASTRA